VQRVFSAAELAGSLVSVSVIDKDISSDDFLGRCAIPVERQQLVHAMRGMPAQGSLACDKFRLSWSIHAKH